MAKKIKITKGKFAIVDDEDFEFLSQFSWQYSNGYAVRSLRSGVIRMHRIINNTPTGYFTDHINGNGLDNRKCNLRTATRSQNGANRKSGDEKKSSKYKGVRFDKENQKWQARITVLQKQIGLGRFDSEVLAAQAYNIAAKEMFGDFANLNAL